MRWQITHFEHNFMIFVIQVSLFYNPKVLLLIVRGKLTSLQNFFAKDGLLSDFFNILRTICQIAIMSTVHDFQDSYLPHCL